MIKVLFVCLGNICRSPMAEAIFNRLLAERGLQDLFFTDSAGTSAWHIGSDPDPRTVSCALQNATPINHKARQVSRLDCDKFDYVLAMDESNYRDIQAVFSKSHSGFYLMRHFDDMRDSHDVPDPYYGGPEGFQHVYEILRRSCNKLLDHIIEEKKL